MHRFGPVQGVRRRAASPRPAATRRCRRGSTRPRPTRRALSRWRASTSRATSSILHALVRSSGSAASSAATPRIPLTAVRRRTGRRRPVGGAARDPLAGHGLAETDRARHLALHAAARTSSPSTASAGPAWWSTWSGVDFARLIVSTPTPTPVAEEINAAARSPLGAQA